jgi:RNA polymerase primary sigma factor
MYMHEVLATPHLIREQEIGLAKRINGGGQEAADAEKQIIEANLVATAKRYHNPGRSLLDLLQEGNLGLLRAVRKFDHTPGYKFSTYAIWWIRSGINPDPRC